MLPEYEDLDWDDEDSIEEDMEEVIIPTKTFALNFDTMHIEGYIDGAEALKQAVLKIVNTEAEAYPIYDAGYGVNLIDLIGTDVNYAMAAATFRLENAILQDDRFESVDFSNKSINGNKISMDITVNTVDGEAVTQEGVELDV